MTNTEASILGLALRYPGLFATVAMNLKEDDFGDRHRAIYRAMLELHRADKPIDIAAIRDKIGEDGPPMKVYLSLMENAAFTPDDGAESVMQSRIETLKLDHGVRSLISTTARILQKPEINKIDLELIGAIVEHAKFKGREQESGDLDEAIVSYTAQVLSPETGIDLGLPTFDFHIDGFRFGELITLMSRSGVGKTFLALNILDHLVKTIRGKYLIGFFSLEMPKEGIVERIFQLHFNLSRKEVSSRVARGILDRGDFDNCYKVDVEIDGQIKKIPTMKLYQKIYNVATIGDIVDQEGIKIVFIDFVHLLKSSFDKSEYERITGLMREIKQLAKDKQIVCFALHQLSRAAKTGAEPVTIDMARDSGAVEELSDFIVGAWCLWKDPEYSETHKNEITLRLLKNKRGPEAIQTCYYDPNSRRIREIEKQRLS